MLRECVLMGASSFSFPGVYRERTSIDAQTLDSFNKCFFNLQPSNQQFVMSHATACMCVYSLCAQGEICPDRTQLGVCVCTPLTVAQSDRSLVVFSSSVTIRSGFLSIGAKNL